MDQSEASERPAKRQRASRKGQPRRFLCHHQGCDKRYSRAEHLARHQLNHTPKQIYRCPVGGCDHTFVRLDLYMRHTKKHAESDDPSGPGSIDDGKSTQSPERVFVGSHLPLQAQLAEPHSTIMSPLSGSHWTAVTPSMATISPYHVADAVPNHLAAPSLKRKLSIPSAVYMQPSTNDINPYDTNLIDPVQANDNFAAWLFESPGSQEQEFDLTSLPFFDYGIDLSPPDSWNLEGSTTANFNVPSTNTTTLDHHRDASKFDVNGSDHSTVSFHRRDILVSILSKFRARQRLSQHRAYVREDGLMFDTHERSWPNVTPMVLENCLSAFWRTGAQQIPIIHQPTFSTQHCNPLLLLAMIAFGAYQIVRSNPKHTMVDYREFADLLITNLRWEIFTDDDAHPPVQLWVAQSLLLIEFCEKMFSTRRLHERAHIHHSSTLTLLRRGSPLVGNSGSDSPPSGLPTRATTPVEDADCRHLPPPASRTAKPPGNMRWWRRWAQTESMHRVVFTAFQMDALHAVLFGHESSLFPYEIRLPLPCDDALWHAQNPDGVHRLETTFQMHGIGSVQFLDGLKRCLHGHDVQLHQHARMILMAGLLSVGWHIYRREKHLQFLETVPSSKEHDRWSALLLKAFGHWRQNFEEALSSRTQYTRNAGATLSNESAADPAVLFHLAQITMHSDIIDCQIFAGLKRLIGRKVSDKDYATVVQRMRMWASTHSARIAILHAYKILRETLGTSSEPSRVYTCRTDPSIYRPWTLYLAALAIWAHQRATQWPSADCAPAAPPAQARQEPDAADHAIALQYLAVCAAPEDPDELPQLTTSSGCAAVLSVLALDFHLSESELVQEASQRLLNCRRMLQAT